MPYSFVCGYNQLGRDVQLASGAANEMFIKLPRGFRLSYEFSVRQDRDIEFSALSLPSTVSLPPGAKLVRGVPVSEAVGEHRSAQASVDTAALRDALVVLDAPQAVKKLTQLPSDQEATKEVPSTKLKSDAGEIRASADTDRTIVLRWNNISSWMTAKEYARKLLLLPATASDGSATTPPTQDSS